jgi:flagellar assembly protein FliH
LEAKVEKKLLFRAQETRVQNYTFQEFDAKKRVPEVEKAAPLEGSPSEDPLNEEALPEDIKALKESARKKGYAEGYAQGLTEGLSEGKDEASASLKRLGEIIVSLDRFRENRLAELSPNIIELSLEISKKIVHKEIDLDRNLIVSVARDAIQKVIEKEENVVVKVSQLDYEVMISYIDLLKEQSGLKNISVEPSAAISPGGCYIETLTGEVDARLEEQMKEIEDVISTATHRKM